MARSSFAALSVLCAFAVSFAISGEAAPPKKAPAKEGSKPAGGKDKTLSGTGFTLQERGGGLDVDAVEYLVTNNNFLTVLRLVQAVRDQAAVNNGVLLLSVNPSTLDAHQMTLLEREVDRVVDASAGPPSTGSG